MAVEAAGHGVVTNDLALVALDIGADEAILANVVIRRLEGGELQRVHLR